jgi:hypothetical protein
VCPYCGGAIPEQRGRIVRCPSCGRTTDRLKPDPRAAAMRSERSRGTLAKVLVGALAIAAIVVGLTPLKRRRPAAERDPPRPADEQAAARDRAPVSAAPGDPLASPPSADLAPPPDLAPPTVVAAHPLVDEPALAPPPRSPPHAISKEPSRPPARTTAHPLFACPYDANDLRQTIEDQAGPLRGCFDDLLVAGGARLTWTLTLNRGGRVLDANGQLDGATAPSDEAMRCAEHAVREWIFPGNPAYRDTAASARCTFTMALRR